MNRALGALGLALGLVLLVPAVLTAAEAVAFALGVPGPVALVEAWFAPVCHHDPSRTLSLAGRLLPLCARCTGLYTGVALGGSAGIALGRPPVLRAAVITAIVLGATGLAAAVLEAVGVLSTGNGARAALGFALGLGPTAIAGMGVRILVAEARATP